MGLTVGHEQIKIHGGCGYQFAVHEWKGVAFAKGWRPALSEFTYVQMLVRNPMDCIASMMANLEEHHLQFQTEHVPELAKIMKYPRYSSLSRWAYGYFSWNQRCQALIDEAKELGIKTAVNRVEDDEWWMNMAASLYLNAGRCSKVPKTVNRRLAYNELTWAEFMSKCDAGIASDVVAQAVGYGYLPKEHPLVELN